LINEEDSVFKIIDSYKTFLLKYQFNPRMIQIEFNSSIYKKIENFHSFSSIKLSNAMKQNILNKFNSIKDNQIVTKRFFTVDQEENKIIKISQRKFFLIGVVIDLGTTSIVLTLINLDNGQILSSESILNPQIKYGRDIISRMTYSILSLQHQSELQDLVLDEILRAIKLNLKKEKLNPNNILEIIVVGNTVMHHLINSFPLSKLAKAPFSPVTTSMISKPLESFSEKNILINFKNCVITFPPLIGGFIGSDAVADILYLDLRNLAGTHLLIDFGTNSEIIIVKNRKVYAASVAAGGAFEGQHISCGMRGINGAIERFKIQNSKFIFQTISSEKPKGICGSGIIDVLAQLLIHGYLDGRGRLFDQSSNKIEKLVLVKKEDYYVEKDIYLSRKDIEEIQKAKAATMAAIRILLDYLHIELKDLTNIHIAGVFGSNLDLGNAKKIGLLPNIIDEKIIIHGNIAEKGARSYLLSMDARKEAEIIVRCVEKIDLTNFPKFQVYFSEELFFPDYKEELG